MSAFLEFLSAAADVALTLQLKAALVAAGFITMLVLSADDSGRRLTDSRNLRQDRVPLMVQGIAPWHPRPPWPLLLLLSRQAHCPIHRTRGPPMRPAPQ